MQINEVEAGARDEMKETAQPVVIEDVSSDIGQDKVDQYLKDVEDVLNQIKDY